MAFNPSESDDVMADINMVPFVDIVLVLLIIFIVTASAIVKAAINVDLPKSSTASSVSTPPLSIVIGCQEKEEVGSKAVGCTPGKVLVDGKEVLDLSQPNADVSKLVTAIKAEQRKLEEEAPEGEEDPVLNVLITADKDMRFQNVIWLMDLLKNQKVGSIMFNSELFTKPGTEASLPPP